MNDSSKKHIQNLLVSWLGKSDKHTASELAKKTEVSTSYISQVKNGKWDDQYPSVAIFQKLQNFLGDSHHIDSENFLNIQGILGKVMHFKSRGAINGGTSGEGKTYSIRKFCEVTPGAYHIICRKSMTSKGLLQTVAKALKLDSNRLTRFSLEEQIADYLVRRKGLLIFDECEYLKGKDAFDSIKTLCDLVEGKAGIVVCGLGLQNIVNTLASRGKVGMPQFKRRFDWKWLHTAPIKTKEVREFCKVSGITDKHAVAWFVDKVNDYDTLVTLVKDALQLAKALKISVISVDFLNEYFQN